jgi:hypothetical protein
MMIFEQKLHKTTNKICKETPYIQKFVLIFKINLVIIQLTMNNKVCGCAYRLDRNTRGCRVSSMYVGIAKVIGS